MRLLTFFVVLSSLARAATHTTTRRIGVSHSPDGSSVEPHKLLIRTKSKSCIVCTVNMDIAQLQRDMGQQLKKDMVTAVEEGRKQSLKTNMLDATREEGAARSGNSNYQAQDQDMPEYLKQDQAINDCLKLPSDKQDACFSSSSSSSSSSFGGGGGGYSTMPDPKDPNDMTDAEKEAAAEAAMKEQNGGLEPAGLEAPEMPPVPEASVNLGLIIPPFPGINYIPPPAHAPPPQLTTPDMVGAASGEFNNGKNGAPSSRFKEARSGLRQRRVAARQSPIVPERHMGILESILGSSRSSILLQIADAQRQSARGGSSRSSILLQIADAQLGTIGMVPTSKEGERLMNPKSIVGTVGDPMRHPGYTPQNNHPAGGGPTNETTGKEMYPLSTITVCANDQVWGLHLALLKSIFAGLPQKSLKIQCFPVYGPEDDSAGADDKKDSPPRSECHCRNFDDGMSAGCEGMCCGREGGLFDGTGGDGKDSECMQATARKGCVGTKNMWGQKFCKWAQAPTSREEMEAAAATAGPRMECHCKHFDKDEVAGCKGWCCGRTGGLLDGDGGDGADTDCAAVDTKDGCGKQKNIWGQEFCKWAEFSPAPAATSPECHCQHFDLGETVGCSGSCCAREGGLLTGSGGDGSEVDCIEAKTEGDCSKVKNMWQQSFCNWGIPPPPAPAA